MPASVVGAFEGNAGAFQKSMSSMPLLVIGALIVVYVILGFCTRVTFIHLPFFQRCLLQGSAHCWRCILEVWISR